MNRSPRSASMASAVAVRIGSITTIRAPRERAVSMVGQRWRLVSLVLVPHNRMSWECSSSSASMPRPVPFVIRMPAPTVGPQMLRSMSDAPMCPKKRPLRPIIDRRLWLPASENGSTASAPWAAITPCRRSAISASASAHEIGSNSPEPFGPTRRSGVSDPVGAVDAIEEAVDLRTQLTGRERVGDVAAQLHRNGAGTVTFDGRRPAARVGAVVVARPVDRAGDRHPAMIARTCGHANANPAWRGSASTSSNVNQPTASVSKLMDSPNGSSTSTTTVV